MPVHEINEAEQAFFGLLQEDGLPKYAVELAAETVDALGIPSVSPSMLDQLEEQASQLEPPVPDESVEVATFDRADDPPSPDEEASPEPVLPERATHGRLFSDKRANPLQILDVLTMRYKDEWPKWESDTLWWAIRRDFGPVGEVCRNKIGALRVAVSTDIPWLDWDVFEDCGLAWNDIIPVIGTFQPMTPMQTAFAFHILQSIRPDEKLNHEVRAYIGAILDDHGFVYAPEPMFGPVQDLLDRKVWLTGFRSDVAMTWEKVKGMNPEDIDWKPDDPMDIHVLKLAVVQRYLAERAALREKVPGIPANPSTVSPPVP